MISAFLKKHCAVQIQITLNCKVLHLITLTEQRETYICFGINFCLAAEEIA